MATVFNHPVWSVSVELVAYSMFYAWAAIIGFSKMRTLAMFALSLGIRAVVGFNLIALCFVYFCIGCLLYEAYTALPRRGWLAAGAISMVCLVIGGMGMGQTDGKAYQLSVMAMATGLVGMGIFLGPVRSSSFGAAVSLLGNLTYASYMIHMPILVCFLIISQKLTGSLDVTREAWFAISFVIMTFVASRFVFLYFEQPAQDWLRNILLPKKGDRTLTSDVPERQRHVTASRDE